MEDHSDEEPSDADNGEDSPTKEQLIADLAKAKGQISEAKGQISELNSELETTQTTLVETEDQLKQCVKQRTEQDSVVAHNITQIAHKDGQIMGLRFAMEAGKPPSGDDQGETPKSLSNNQFENETGNLPSTHNQGSSQRNPQPLEPSQSSESSSESDSESNDSRAQRKKRAKSSKPKSCGIKVSNLPPWSGNKKEEDTVNIFLPRLFQHLQTQGLSKRRMPQHVLPFLKGRAFQLWQLQTTTLQTSKIVITWELFETFMKKTFGQIAPERQARLQYDGICTVIKIGGLV
jgi:hypothetical protein